MLTIDRTKYMDRGELKRLFDSTRTWAADDLAAGHRHGVVAWMIVDYIAQTGFRPSELAGDKLLCQDIDVRRKLVTVTRSKKKREVRNTLPISKDLAKHLKDFLAWKVNVGESIEGADPLFIGERGESIGPRGIARKFKAALVRAGFRSSKDDRYTVRSARHSMGVFLHAKTKNLPLVQKQLGHAKIETTMAYVDVEAGEVREGVTNVYA